MLSTRARWRVGARAIAAGLVCCGIVALPSVASSAPALRFGPGEPSGTSSSSWAIHTVQGPTYETSNADLTSVSCSGPGDCSAVGYYINRSGTYGNGVLLTETSGSWGPGAAVVLPANAAARGQYAELSSVSCSSPGYCSAIGYYTDSSGNTDDLVVTETAGAWGSAAELALPAGAATADQIAGPSVISCSGPGDCSAVGEYTDSSGHVDVMLLTETAGAWGSAVEAALPSNRGTDPYFPPYVNSVSCAAPGNCSAVGNYTDSSGHSEAFFITQASGAWAAAVGTTPSASLWSVSCASRGNCTAVGGDLVFNENAGVWGTGTQVLGPTSTAVHLEAVSCSPGGNCSAVGSYDDSSGHHHGVLLNETAGTWAPAIEAALAPGAGTDPQVSFSAISCALAGNCSAIGTFTNDRSRADHSFELIETAGAWGQVVQTPLPANANLVGATLSSVSCGAPGDCAVAGTYGITSYSDAGGSGGLLLSEASGIWSPATEAPLPKAASYPYRPLVGFTSLSCPSAGNCTAVGGQPQGPSVIPPIVLDEKDGRWGTPAPPAFPPDAGSYPVATLTSVSCPSAGNCAVAGYYTDLAGNQQGVLLGERAGHWATGQEVVLPAGASSSPMATLTSVSCPSTRYCAAVGNYIDASGHQQALVVTGSVGKWARGTRLVLPANANTATQG
ncbi:MAG TPA: hypothetical protein VFN61_11965, partial [Acidimicrobiales bacterium]|nr:hypothetical protein [Acidimicrobiales bacterium]